MTSLASCFFGCLKFAALACKLRTICTSAIFKEICPVTLYLQRCCTPSTAEKMISLVVPEWPQYAAVKLVRSFLPSTFTFPLLFMIVESKGKAIYHRSSVQRSICVPMQCFGQVYCLQCYHSQIAHQFL